VANILDKSVVRASGDSFQVTRADERSLCVPALRLESTLADVVVASRARKGEVVRLQVIEGVKVFLYPSGVPLPDDLLVP